MAKKKTGGVNKSQAIRDYLKTKPDAGPTEVCRELKKKGLSIAPALVSNVKAAMLGKKRGVKRGGGAVSVEALLEAREFVDKVGGVQQAEQIIKTLAKLS